MLFHINGNGEVKPCNATKNRCQFGDETLHFQSRDEADDFIDHMKAAKCEEALRGTKRSIDAFNALISKSASEYRPTTRAQVARKNRMRPIIPVPNAVVSGHWEMGGFFRTRMSFVCGDCATVNKRMQWNSVVVDRHAFVVSTCSYCLSRNMFMLDNRTWLVYV